jgi:hypothetical protein
VGPIGVSGSRRRSVGAVAFGARGRARTRAVAVLALGMFGSTGCAVDSPSLDVPAQTGATGALTPPPASGVPSTYTGLGSRLQAFDRGHRTASSARAAAGAGKGPVASEVTTNAAGRVTGYVTTFNYQPPLSDLQRLASAVDLGDLPADRITTRAGPTCLVYASPTMKRLVGRLYTSVLTTPGSRTADVAVTQTPSC